MKHLSHPEAVSASEIFSVCFTFYQWLMNTYEIFDWDDKSSRSKRAVLVALGIVYYMRLDEANRKNYLKALEEESDFLGDIKFKKAFR